METNKYCTPKKKWLGEVSKKTIARPSSIVMYGPTGIGKTSFGAATIKPVFLIDEQEDGVNTLKASRLIAEEIPVLPAAKAWADVMGQIEELAFEPHDYKTLVIDTIGGLERLCHTFVCSRDFRGDWGEKGFSSYQRGYDIALPEWRKLLAGLDKLRNERGMMIVALSHSLIRPFKNPAAEDYDRYTVDMHHKTWAATSKWADMILFANYFVAIDKGKSNRERAKGKGGQERILHTEYEAAFDAKNRHGLPTEISMGNSGHEAWNNLVTAILSARKEKENGN